MDIKALIEALSQMPPDHPVEITKVLAIGKEGDAFQVTLDAPIIGVADMNNSAVLIIEAEAHIMGLGNVVRLSEDAPPKTYYGNATEVNGEMRLIEVSLQENPRLPTEAARNLSHEGHTMHVVRIDVIGTYRGKGQPFKPNWAVAPGEALNELLEHFEMDLLRASEITGIEIGRLGGILAATIQVTEEDAEMLAKLRYNKQFWLNYEKNYQEALKQKKVPS